MPRPYSLRRRQAATDQTRARILAAARELMVSSTGFAGFTIGAVARQASVAPMTIYYQFGAKRGLLEAVFDDLAARGGMERMVTVHALAEPLEALHGMIAVFGHFWATDRLVMRRIRALAALDVELAQAVRERDGWRRHHCQDILGRLSERYGKPARESLNEAIEVLNTLTSFETFDTLAGPARSPEDVTSVIQRLAHAAIGMPA
jgi:AcrR family transcriptional regulator